MLTVEGKKSSLQKWDEILAALEYTELADYLATRPAPDNVCGVCESNTAENSFFPDCSICPLAAVAMGEVCHPLWHSFCDLDEDIRYEAKSYKRNRKALIRYAQGLRDIIAELEIDEG